MRAMLIAALFALAGCATMSVSLSDLLADGRRPASDRARDDARMPVAMMEFAGIRNGSKVAEILPGAGYFTRVLSVAVGPQGRVYSVIPQQQLDKEGDESEVLKIARDPAFPNVHLVPNLDRFAHGIRVPEKVDVVIIARNYHDFRLKMNKLDIPVINRSIYDSLRPGGIYVVIDHAADVGAPVTVADTHHRVDPELVRRDIEAVGFEFVGKSDALRNPSDDHTKKVFAPDLRDRTDQFVYKFRKPS